MAFVAAGANLDDNGASEQRPLAGLRQAKMTWCTFDPLSWPSNRFASTLSAASSRVTSARRSGFWSW